MSDGPIPRATTVVVRAAASQNKATDHYVLAYTDEAARADVAQFRIGRLIKVVGFDQSDSGSAIFSAHDGGVTRRVECRDNGGLQVIRRREPGGLNICFIRVLSNCRC